MRVDQEQPGALLNGVEGVIWVDQLGVVTRSRLAFAADPRKAARFAARVAVVWAAQRRLGAVEGLGMGSAGLALFGTRVAAWAERSASGLVLVLGQDGASPGLVLSWATRLAAEED